MKSYQQAAEVAEKGLAPTHPIRLGNYDFISKLNYKGLP